MKKLLLNSKSFVIAFVMANLFMFSSTGGFAAVRTASVTGNWNNTATWGGLSVPTAADDVTINSGITVTVTVNAAANTITFPTGNAASSTVTINSGITLAVTGSITIPRAANPRINTLAVGAGTLTAGSIDFTSSGTNVRHEVTIFTGTVTATNITADAGATGSPSVTFSGAGLLKIAGTIFTNTLGTLTQSTGTVEYNGTNQTIGDFTYNGLTISGGGAKTLAASTTVGGTLTVTSGQLVVPTAMTLTLSSTNAIAGASLSAANSIVTQVNTGTGAKGVVNVNIGAGASRLIPVSNGTNYLPVTINPTNASTYNVTVFNGVTTNALPNGTPFGATPKKEIVDAVWNIGLASGTGTGVGLTLGWQGALEGSTFAATTLTTQAGIAQSTAGIWANPQQNSGVLHTSSTRTGLTLVLASSFAVGKIYPAGGTLPIKVVYFNAAKGNGYNTLNWSAESTSESASFDIERSADGKNFTAISTIAASRLDMLQPFNYVDNSNLTGTVYYRIKIIDFNGKVTYSSVVRIASAVNDMKLVAVLPNPVSNTAQLNVVSAKKDNVQLSVVSMTGQLVQRSTVQLQSGSSIINLDVANLQSGMYTIKGTFSDGTVSTVKFVKQ